MAFGTKHLKYWVLGPSRNMKTLYNADGHYLQRVFGLVRHIVGDIWAPSVTDMQSVRQGSLKASQIWGSDTRSWFQGMGHYGAM